MIRKERVKSRSVSDVFKIMIGQLHGDDIINFMKPGHKIDLALNRLGFNNGNYLAIRQHSMYFDAFKCSNPSGYGIGAPFKATDHNS